LIEYEAAMELDSVSGRLSWQNENNQSLCLIHWFWMLCEWAL